MRATFLRLTDVIGGLTLVLFVCGQLGADEAAPVTVFVEAVEAAEPATPAKPAGPAEKAVPVAPATPAKPAEPAEKAVPGTPATPAKPAEPAEKAEPVQHEEREDVVIKRGSQAAKYRLGIALVNVPKALDEQLRLKGEGLLVTEVVKDSPAAKAGIYVHDILLKANNGQSLDNTGLLPSIVDATQGKDLTVQVMRAGEKLTITMTPQKIEAATKKGGGLFSINTNAPFSEEIEKELRVFEERVREKLHDAGIDVRIQLVKPGKFVAKDVVLSIKAPALPDDVSITFCKEGNAPGDIEVKKGDQVWRLKENELGELPEVVRAPVEVVLGRGPMRLDFRTMTDRVARHPELLGTSRTDNSGADPKEAERAVAKKLDEYHQGLGFFGYDKNSAPTLKKQVDEMSRNLNKMQEDMQALRKTLQERSATIKD